MGIAPLGMIDLFSKSSGERKEREQLLLDYLRSLKQLDPGNLWPKEFDLSLLSGRKSPLFEPREGVSLSVSRRTAPDRSCHGRFSIFDIQRGRPKESDWADVDALCTDVLARGLCDSVSLARGCKGFLGMFHSWAVLGAPDAARLAILHRLDLLLADRLDLVMRDLDFSVAPERFCMSVWKKVVRDCRADARFSIMVKPVQ